MDINTYEATLEDMVINNIGFVQTRGFPKVYDKTVRQFKFPTGRVCDVLSYEIVGNSLNCKIFELKRGELDISALLQVVNYGADVVRYSFFNFEKINIELYLVGSDVDTDLFTLCAWGTNVKIITFDYKVDGIHFEEWESLGIYPNPYWMKEPSEHTRPSDEEIFNWREIFSK
jgi:hypothetical protein